MHVADGWIIALYLAFSLGVGFWVREKAGRDTQSYFLANRSLPWWWAGASIAATTFAADTPLAITGIIANRGISGNWMWLSWIGVHAAVAVYFARTWSTSGVVTDAELVTLRYAGKAAEPLRLFRAGLYGIVFNCIVLGWVLKAMTKIAAPFFDWKVWAPWLYGALASFWPEGSTLGTPSDGLTILSLLVIVAVYSSLGGIRGVIFTDLIQLGLALFGSTWLAVAAWTKAGGRRGLLDRMQDLYGAEAHHYLDLFPRLEDGWVEAAGLGAFTFGMYLFVQAFANLPADGGGYFMQRLNSTRSPRDAKKAAHLFVVLQYVVRVWPWMITGIAALVLIPVGHENELISGAGKFVAGDRESAYPVLVLELLPPGVLGVMVASLLAAFMSTIDTHINWGAAYVANDFHPLLRPDAAEREQMWVARVSVVGFAVLAVIVCLNIDTIEQAWQWVAALGAALGPVTALRWLWWRITAWTEIASSAVGLIVAAALLAFTDVSYEQRIIIIAAASTVALFLEVWLGAPRDARDVEGFVQHVRPDGFWPGRSTSQAVSELLRRGIAWLMLIGAVVGACTAGHRMFLSDAPIVGALVGVLAIVMYLAADRLSPIDRAPSASSG